MKPRISLLTLGVDDLERALAFCRDGLGLSTPGIVGTEFEQVGCSHGASPPRRCPHSEECGGHILGRLFRLLSGSRWSLMGDCVESSMAGPRLAERGDGLIIPSVRRSVNDGLRGLPFGFGGMLPISRAVTRMDPLYELNSRRSAGAAAARG
jgi:hypothetical protein